MSNLMPTKEQVCAYGTRVLNKLLANAANINKEHQEEIRQEAYLRLLEAYPDIDPSRGWKSFVYTHVKGAIFDYMKSGAGFKETNWSLQADPKPGKKHKDKIRYRVSKVNEDGEDLPLDDALGTLGAFHEAMNHEQIKIRWDLVCCMAAQDEFVEAFAKYIRGQSAEEMSGSMEFCRSRSGQFISSFISKFDDPWYDLLPGTAEYIWFKQICYAFGLCKLMKIPDIDQSLVVGYPVGWSKTHKRTLDELDGIVDRGPSKQTTIFDVPGVGNADEVQADELTVDAEEEEDDADSEVDYMFSDEGLGIHDVEEEI